MKNYIQIIILVIFGSIVAYFAMAKIDRYLNLKAINDCAKEYTLSYTNSENGTTIIRPLEEPFKECVWQKGVKNYQGTSK